MGLLTEMKSIYGVKIKRILDSIFKDMSKKLLQILSITKVGIIYGRYKTYSKGRSY